MNSILTDDERRAIMSEWTRDSYESPWSLLEATEAAVLAKLREQEAVRVAEMPKTDDRRLYDPEKPDGYLESDNDWIDRNREAVSWLIGNHASIRAALATPLPAVVQVPPLTEDQIKRHSMLAADCPGASAVILVSSLRRLLAVAPEAPALPAEVQVPQLVAKELERIAQDPPISGNGIAQARVLMAARSIRDFGLSGGAATPNAPALPAVVREALKVAREALGKVDTACRLIPEDLEGYLEPLSDALSDARAAIARLDALGGVE